MFDRAEIARRDGRCADAVPLYQTAATQFTAQAGASSAYLAYPWVGEASCQISLGHTSEALRLLDRAAALGLRDPLLSAQAQAARGRALVESGRDPHGGLALARAARTAMAAVTGDADAPSAVAELDRWLAAHDR